jgi:transcriptional regulator with XRE-family HTH domain
MSDDPVSNARVPFGKFLKERRQAAGLSRIVLAQKVQMDPSYLFRIEAGERFPSVELVLGLAGALQLDAATRDAWLAAAGFAPIREISSAGGAVRTRGAVQGQVARRGAIQTAVRRARTTRAVIRCRSCFFG